MMRRKSSGLIRSRFGVAGKLMIGPPRPSRPPDKNATRSCSSVMMSIARTPLSIALFVYLGVDVFVFLPLPLNFAHKLNKFNLISLAVLCVEKKREGKL
jgi:hypothetical protein